MSVTNIYKMKVSFSFLHIKGGRGVDTRRRRLLRHCVANWKVAGSIPVGATGIFNGFNPSGRPVALGSTQSLTKISIRDTSRGRGECGRYVGLTTLPLSTGTLRLP